MAIHSSQTTHLPRSLGVVETWGFGFSGLLLWLGTVPSLEEALDLKAIAVWIPIALLGMLLNWQVRRLGNHLPHLSGGTPNYAAYLLRRTPKLGVYGAIGYWLGWVSVPAMNAIILTDIIQSNLAPFEIIVPQGFLKAGFILLPFLMAFSGTRTLGILHAFFVLPAIGLLLTFCFQGLFWLSFAPGSPGLFPRDWAAATAGTTPLNAVEWAKWSFIAVYAACGCETASSFVADSRYPKWTLRTLSGAAILLPVVYVGGSWVISRLTERLDLGHSTFLQLTAAGQHFWGGWASGLVVFLLACGGLLSSATAVSNTPRILYQLSLEGYIAPVFGMVSRRGVLAPGLIFTLLCSLLTLLWGDVTRVVMITGVSYFLGVMAVHLGSWINRDEPWVLAGWLSGGIFLVELAMLLVGGWSWSPLDLGVGICLPLVVMQIDRLIRRFSWGILRPEWWLNYYRHHSQTRVGDLLLVQVGTLMALLTGATAIAWVVRDWLSRVSTTAAVSNVFVLLLIVVVFVGVAIACWTSLPQIARIVEAQEDAEHLFTIAVDAIVILDATGTIQAANPAAEALFQRAISRLVGRHLSYFLPELSPNPQQWQSRSEQLLRLSQWETAREKIVEVALSARSRFDVLEYVAIVRDITARKEAEAQLYGTLQLKDALAEEATATAQRLSNTLEELQRTQAQLIQTEKMSSLGQLVAGIAHEINNPINFIHGNLQHIQDYSHDLLNLIKLYQQEYPAPSPAIEDQIVEMDLPFLQQDLPKILNSLKTGTERIRQIVLTLRNFSRLDESDFKTVDIHEGLESTLVILQNRLKSKPNHPSVQLIRDYGTLPAVECYAGQLNQVFMNLISNALDALEEHFQTSPPPEDNPQLIIRTETTPDQWVKISIQDNGPGIPLDLQRRLFDPFFTTKPVGKGTGLGLAISYQIVVEKHGGKMTCLSQPGAGATFEVLIPIRRS